MRPQKTISRERISEFVDHNYEYLLENHVTIAEYKPGFDKRDLIAQHFVETCYETDTQIDFSKEDFIKKILIFAIGAQTMYTVRSTFTTLSWSQIGFTGLTGRLPILGKDGFHISIVGFSKKEITHHALLPTSTNTKIYQFNAWLNPLSITRLEPNR